MWPDEELLVEDRMEAVKGWRWAEILLNDSGRTLGEGERF